MRMLDIRMLYFDSRHKCDLLKLQDIDWGSIDVFTCSRSCQPDNGSPYVTEYIWKQPSPMSESAIEAVAAVATTAVASTDTSTA